MKKIVKKQKKTKKKQTKTKQKQPPTKKKQQQQRNKKKPRKVKTAENISAPIKQKTKTSSKKHITIFYVLTF